MGGTKRGARGRVSRGRGGVAVLALLLLMAGIGAVSSRASSRSAARGHDAHRASTGTRLGSTAGQPATSQPPPCPGRQCLPPCVLRAPILVDCESRQPTVTLEYTAEGAGCDYIASIQWGDGQHKVVDFTQPGNSLPQDDEPSLKVNHTYTESGDYAVTLNVEETGTPAGCSSDTSLPELDFDVSILDSRYDLVAVGDSYSSGEGTFDYDDFRYPCHRSPQAWSRMLPELTGGKVSKVLLLACSGAQSADLSGRGTQPDQFRLLHAVDTNLVTVTIGGNDIGFVPVLTNCYEHSTLMAVGMSFLRSCAENGKIAHMEKVIDTTEEPKLVQDYLKLAAAAPKARILVVGYPQLFPPDLKAMADPSSVSCAWLSQDDGVVLFELALAENLLNVTIQDAAEVANAKLARGGSANRIAFVSVSGALQGHELCTRDPWLNNVLPVPNVREFAHPTRRGQQAIAAVVAHYIKLYL